MYIYVQVFCMVYICITLGCVYLGMKLLSHVVTHIMFNLLRNCQAVSQSCHTVFHSQQLCI